MVIIDVYGKINKTVISDKLKIYISNLPSDWKEVIIKDMLQEVRKQKIMLNNKNTFGIGNQPEYSLEHFKKIIQSNITYNTYNLDSIENCVKYIVDNMIYLFFTMIKICPFLIGQMTVLMEDYVKKIMLKK